MTTYFQTREYGLQKRLHQALDACHQHNLCVECRRLQDEAICPVCGNCSLCEHDDSCPRRNS